MRDFGNMFLKVCKKFLFFLLSLAILIAIVCGILYATSNIVIIKKIEVQTVPYHDIKIVQLSDFNNKVVKGLAEKVNEQNPDIVVITGDLVDKYKTNTNNEDVLLKQFEKIKAPIYFVPGDMEYGYRNYEKLKTKMQEKEIHILENATETIQINNEYIDITGIVDSSAYYEDLEKFNDQLRSLKTTNPQILLSHRPELINLYAENGYAFVLCGHTHGGYIQIPFVGAIFASNQGVMPKYVNGEYKVKDTTMIVSSGLGVGRFPVRLFNQPEIVNINGK